MVAMCLAMVNGHGETLFIQAFLDHILLPSVLVHESLKGLWIMFRDSGDICYRTCQIWWESCGIVSSCTQSECMSIM